MFTNNTKLRNTFKNIGTDFHAGQLESYVNQEVIANIKEGWLLEAVANSPISAMHGEPVYRIARSTNQQEIVNFGQGAIDLKPLAVSDTAPVDAVIIRLSGYAVDPDSPQSPTGTEAFPQVGQRQAYVVAGSGPKPYLAVDETIATPSDVPMSSDITYDIANKVFSIKPVAAGIVPSKFRMAGTVIDGIRLKDDTTTGQLPVTYVKCKLANFM